MQRRVIAIFADDRTFSRSFISRALFFRSSISARNLFRVHILAFSLAFAAFFFSAILMRLGTPQETERYVR
jgi:hypothetical protein